MDERHIAKSMKDDQSEIVLLVSRYRKVVAWHFNEGTTLPPVGPQISIPVSPCFDSSAILPISPPIGVRIYL